MSAQRPNFFRRASDFLRHKDHSEAVDSAVSSAVQSPEPSRPSSPVDGVTSGMSLLPVLDHTTTDPNLSL